MSTENKIKFFIILILVAFLVFPRTASADIIGILDIFQTQLGALEEFTGVPMNTWVKVVILYIIALICFIATGSLLNWVLKLPLTNPEIVSLSNNFVTNGWAFAAGLVNMGIILILLMIAFAYILKIETFQAKQSFVRLIIVALLINFSLVFVKALFDISNIVYLYILNLAGGDFVVESFRTFVWGLWGVISMLGGIILGLTAPLLIPPAAPFAQLGILIIWLSAGHFILPTWIFQLVIAFIFSFLFLLLFFLFSARIFIIWILTVLSPWAFLCYILPQTKKYWNQWLKWLLDWMFFGAVILFLLVLGLKSIPSIQMPLLVWVGGILPVPGYFYYYFFLFVFLLVVIYLLRKKFMPEFAQFLIDQSKTVGGLIWTRGLKPMGGIAIKGLERGLIAQKKLEEEVKRRKEAGERIPRRVEIASGLARGIATPFRWAYKTLGVTPEFVAAKRVEKEMEKFEKAYGKDIDTAVTAHLGMPVVSPEMKAALGLYLAKMKGAAGINKLSEEEQRKTLEAIAATVPGRLADFVKHRPELIDDEKVGEIIKRTMVSKGMEDDDVKKLIEIGVSEVEAIRKAAFKKAVDAMKVTDVDTLALSTLQNKEFQEMVVRFKDPNFIRRIGEEKGTEYIEALRERAKELGAVEIAKTNLTLLRQSVTNPGFKAVFPPIEGAESIGEVEALGILVTEPLLIEYERLRKSYNELKGRIEKMKPEEVTRDMAEALAKTVEELKKLEEDIRKTPELAKKWEKVEKLKGSLK
jgi:flagellar motor protein MotB